VWPDQDERLSLLRGALELARGIPAEVDSAGAADWIESALAGELPHGATTVVYHSIFWQYLGDDERARIRSALAAAGAQATRSAPLAWLRMEADGATARVDATLWPGSESRLLARVGYHGRPVRWLLDDDREGSSGRRGDRLAR
jgi:hypothetical protein